VCAVTPRQRLSKPLHANHSTLTHPNTLLDTLTLHALHLGFSHTVKQAEVEIVFLKFNSEYTSDENINSKDEQVSCQKATSSFQLSRRPPQAEKADNATRKQEVTSPETDQ
jgi:hypothetical protein